MVFLNGSQGRSGVKSWSKRWAVTLSCVLTICLNLPRGNEDLYRYIETNDGLIAYGPSKWFCVFGFLLLINLNC